MQRLRDQQRHRWGHLRRSGWRVLARASAVGTVSNEGTVFGTTDAGIYLGIGGYAGHQWHDCAHRRRSGWRSRYGAAGTVNNQGTVHGAASAGGAPRRRRLCGEQRRHFGYLRWPVWCRRHWRCGYVDKSGQYFWCGARRGTWRPAVWRSNDVAGIITGLEGVRFQAEYTGSTRVSLGAAGHRMPCISAAQHQRLSLFPARRCPMALLLLTPA